MNDLKIQQNSTIYTPSAKGSYERAQLFAKNSDNSSIDQKSVGCISSIWNAVVSVLSNIWHFFTACCSSNSSQKKTHSEPESLEEELKISFKLQPESLIAFAKRANPILKERINKDDHGLKDDKLVLFWIEINNEKSDMICSVKAEDVDVIYEQIKVFCTDNAEMEFDASAKFKMCALLMEYKQGPDQNFRYTFVSEAASMKIRSSQLELSGNTGRENSQKLSKDGAFHYTSLLLATGEEDSEVLELMKNYITAERIS